MKVPSKRR